MESTSNKIVSFLNYYSTVKYNNCCVNTSTIDTKGIINNFSSKVDLNNSNALINTDIASITVINEYNSKLYSFNSIINNFNYYNSRYFVGSAETNDLATYRIYQNNGKIELYSKIYSGLVTNITLDNNTDKSTVNVLDKISNLNWYYLNITNLDKNIELSGITLNNKYNGLIRIGIDSTVTIKNCDCKIIGINSFDKRITVDNCRYLALTATDNQTVSSGTGTLFVNNTYCKINLNNITLNTYYSFDITNSTINSIPSAYIKNNTITAKNSIIIINDLTPSKLISTYSTNPLVFWQNNNLYNSIFGHTHYHLNPLNVQTLSNYNFTSYFNGNINCQRYNLSENSVNTKYIDNKIKNFVMRTRFNFINLRRNRIF